MTSWSEKALIFKAFLQMYAFNDRPKGRTKEQVDIAVDSLARLSLGQFILSSCTLSRHIHTNIWASGHHTGFEDA